MKGYKNYSNKWINIQLKKYFTNNSNNSSFKLVIQNITTYDMISQSKPNLAPKIKCKLIFFFLLINISNAYKKKIKNNLKYLLPVSRGSSVPGVTQIGISHPP